MSTRPTDAQLKAREAARQFLPDVPSRRLTVERHPGGELPSEALVRAAGLLRTGHRARPDEIFARTLLRVTVGDLTAAALLDRPVGDQQGPAVHLLRRFAAGDVAMEPGYVCEADPIVMTAVGDQVQPHRLSAVAPKEQRLLESLLRQGL